MSNLPPVIAIRDADVAARRRLDLIRGASGALSGDTIELAFSDSHIVQVSKDGPDFNDLNDAIDWINTQADATEQDPYLIKVGPGLWVGSFILPSHCHLEGSGRGVTRFDKDYSVNADPYIIQMSDDTSVSDLSVSFGQSFQTGISASSLQGVHVRRIEAFLSTFTPVDLTFYTGPIEWYASGAETSIDFSISDVSIDDSDLTDLNGNVLIWVHGMPSSDTPVVRASVSEVRATRTDSASAFGVAVTGIKGATMDNIIVDGTLQSSITIGGGDVGTPDGNPTGYLSNCRAAVLSVDGDNSQLLLSGCVFGEIDAPIPAGATITGSWAITAGIAHHLTGHLDIPHRSTPAAPESGHLQLYPKSTKGWYQQDNDGSERRLLTDHDGGVDQILTSIAGEVQVSYISGDVVYAL